MAIAQLSELQSAYPGAEIYLNDELTVDFPEDVKIAVEPNQMLTAEVIGSSLKFSYCGLERAIALFREQYAIGTVEIKLVQLKPFSQG
jgi:inner membrane protein